MSKGAVNFNDILLGTLNKFRREIHVALPAVIDKYDFKTQKANVKINISQVYDGQAINFPIIPNVPVIFPNSGGASFTMPVKVGDTCLLIFCDLDIKNWLIGGNSIKPQTSRSHSLTDAVAIIGLGTFTRQNGVENNEDVLINYAESKIRLKPNGVIDIHNAKEVNIKTNNVVINCKRANIKATDSIALECKTANIKATDAVAVECKNANVKASGAINTETPSFTQKGNMKIDGNVEITGTSLLTGKLTSKSGIANSGGNLVSNNITFESHGHNYSAVTTVTAPPSGGPCAVVTVPTPTQGPVGGRPFREPRAPNWTAGGHLPGDTP